MTKEQEILSEKIISFLTEKELISKRRLQVKLKMPLTTLARAYHTRRIPKKFLYVMEKECNKYGFKSV